MDEERELGEPSSMYVSVCAEGYHDFGFDLTRLIEAYYYSKAEE